MGRRQLKYVKVKKDELDFAIHYVPWTDITLTDSGKTLNVRFDHITLVLSLYLDLDEGDGITRMRTKLYANSKHFDRSFIFGQVIDYMIKDGDSKRAIRLAIEMARNFDIAYSYERQLI